MICGNCGKNISKDSKFCTYCGFNLQSNEKEILKSSKSLTNLFNKFHNPVKKFTVKSGRVKELNKYKVKLVEEVKALKKEKRNLMIKINKNQKDKDKLTDLSNDVKELEQTKSNLEHEIAKMYKARQFTINIKELQQQELILKSQNEQLENSRAKIENDINNLKEEKAILLNEIENINMQKGYAKQLSEFSIEYVDNLNDGFAFENYFATLLDKLGFYDIKVTDGSGDFGIDVLAYNDDILYGFQCKLYSTTVGNKAIQEAYSGKVHYNCNIAIVVTNNYFTEQAIQQAKETKVLLWDRNVLINKLDEASKCNFSINM